MSYHTGMDPIWLIGGCALVVVAVVAVVAVVLVRRYRRQREIFIKFDTMAGPCRVFTIERKDGLVRVMNVAGTMQSATYLDDDTYCDLPYAYTRDYDSMFFAGVPVRDVLVLGGGGYSYPKHLIAHHPETYVTCVEIDPVITAIACRHFFVDRLFEEYDLDETGRLQLVEGDAREFLEETDERYDAIVNDCFSGMSLVESLVTQEAAQLYHEHLRENGVYLANVIGAIEGPRSRMMRRIMPYACERVRTRLRVAGATRHPLELRQQRCDSHRRAMAFCGRDRARGMGARRRRAAARREHG